MKKFVLYPIVAIVLAGGAFFGGAAAADHLWSQSYAEGVEAAADPSPSSVPTDNPIATGSLVWKLYKGGALIPAILVAAFGLLVFLSRKVKWLQEGKRAVWVAGGVTALGMLAEPASRGSTPNLAMIVAALSAMLALVLAPEKKAS